MAIQCEFIDFIIPIKKIDLVYPGGFTKFKEDHAMSGNVKGKLWHDQFLFRDGAMSPMDIRNLVEKFESLGLKGTVEINGKMQWQDFCVVESKFDEPTLPCNWLQYDRDSNCVYLKTKPKGVVIGPRRN